LAPFAGLDRPDQPADTPHILLFIKSANNISFSHNQPVSVVFASRTGPLYAALLDINIFVFF